MPPPPAMTKPSRVLSSARGDLGRVVALGRQGAHRVEHDRKAPALCLARAAEADVLLTKLNLLHADTDAVSTSGAGGGDRVGDALQLERRRQHRRDGRAHRARHTVRANAAILAVVDRLNGLGNVRHRGATLAKDAANARRLDLLGGQAAVRDRLLHREVRVLAVVAHEARLLAIDQLVRVEVGPAADVRLHALLLVGLGELDARLAVVQRLGHVVERVAQARHNAHTGHHHAAVLRTCKGRHS